MRKLINEALAPVVDKLDQMLYDREMEEFWFRSSIHESSHACVFLVVGEGEIEEVRIGIIGGHVHYKNTNWSKEGLQVVELAGRIGEMLFCGKGEFLETDDTMDEGNGLLAKAILQRHKKQVLAIASALRSRGSLSGDEVKRIFEENKK